MYRDFKNENLVVKIRLNEKITAKRIEKKVIAVFKNFARPIRQIFTIFFGKMSPNLYRSEIKGMKW